MVELFRAWVNYRASAAELVLLIVLWIAVRFWRTQRIQRALGAKKAAQPMSWPQTTREGLEDGATVVGIIFFYTILQSMQAIGWL